jgi:hypothetical protein
VLEEINPYCKLLDTGELSEHPQNQ